MSAATVRPWKVLPGTTQIIRDLGDELGETICECEDTSAFVQDEPVNEANAAHIVRCVNSHDQLLEALNRIVGMAHIYAQFKLPSFAEDFAKARAAIANATGAQS